MHKRNNPTKSVLNGSSNVQNSAIWNISLDTINKRDGLTSSSLATHYCRLAYILHRDRQEPGQNKEDIQVVGFCDFGER